MATLSGVIVDDSDSSVHYSGNWVANTTAYTGPRGQSALYDTLHRTESNSFISISFNGTFVSVMGQMLPTSMPKWECFIDDVKLLSVTFTNRIDNLPICSETLQDGAHTLTVIANATQDSPFWFDYIKYHPSASVDLDRLDAVLDPEKSVTFGQGWRVLGPSGSMTNVKDSTLSLNFTGVSLTWLGVYNHSLSGSSATATYAVDGQTPIAFSVTNPTSADTPTMFDQIIFQTSNYSTGMHHLEVVYEGNPQTAPLSMTSLIVQAEPRLSTNLTPSANSPPSNSGLSTNDGRGDSQNVGTIVGGVIGGVSFLALLVTVVLLFLRRKASRDTASGGTLDVVQPFNHNPLLVSGYNNDSSTHRSSKRVDQHCIATGNTTQTLSVPRPGKARTLAQSTVTPLHIRRAPAGEVFVPPLNPPPRAPSPEEILLHLDSGLRLPQPDLPNVIEVPPIYSPI